MKSDPLVANYHGSYLQAKHMLIAGDWPHDHVNPRSCPFHDIRYWSLEEKMEWVDDLGKQAVLNIYHYCRLCSELRKKLE